MVRAAPHKKIIKKRTKKFTRFHSDRYMRLKQSWRRPRGIDNPQRRQFRGQAPLVNIGYGSDKATKFMDPQGFYRFTVHNMKEVDFLLMHNRKYAAVIAKAVGAKERKKIIRRADQLNIRVVNRTGHLKTVEHE